jgi:triphosphoribosyl-dephospho-CoA synthase
MPESADRTDDGAAVRRAFLWACGLDVQARKPGNVSSASAGHRMQAGQFIESAAASAEPLCRPAASVGERIESAVRATRAIVQCNTNLGIVLLCAPIAAAWERRRRGGLRRALVEVLAELDAADARAAYRAIACARPAGLGSAPAQDVGDVPTLGLRDAMALAADRDRIAWQYAHGFGDVFDPGVTAFEQAQRGIADPGAAPVAAMQRVFLEFLATWPDSHIARKHGAALAHSVMVQAGPWLARARGGEVLDADPAFAAWDESLKRQGLNPGTSADLCVATALVWALGKPCATVPQGMAETAPFPGTQRFYADDPARNM